MVRQLRKSSLGRGMGKSGHYAHQITKLFVFLTGRREMIAFFNIFLLMSDRSSEHTRTMFPDDETMQC